jgi:hypothetical protein
MGIIYMWLDWWHPYGILYTRYGQRIAYDAGSKVETKLSSAFKGKEWGWQPARSDEMVNV